MEVGERTVTATADDVMSPSWRGVLAHIHIADSASLPMRSLTTATLVAGKGIPDDRYATHSGTYSDRHHIDRRSPSSKVRHSTRCRVITRVNLSPFGGPIAVGDRIEPRHPDQIDGEPRMRNERVGLVVPPELF